VLPGIPIVVTRSWPFERTAIFSTQVGFGNWWTIAEVGSFRSEIRRGAGRLRAEERLREAVNKAGIKKCIMHLVIGQW
jgi:hypothetical protein